MTQITNHDIAELVREALKQHRDELGAFAFEVNDDLVRFEDGSWYVPVCPDSSIQNRNQLYDVLNQIEQEFADQRDIDILIVPTAPED